MKGTLLGEIVSNIHVATSARKHKLIKIVSLVVCRAALKQINMIQLLMEKFNYLYFKDQCYLKIIII